MLFASFGQWFIWRSDLTTETEPKNFPHQMKFHRQAKKVSTEWTQGKFDFLLTFVYSSASQTFSDRVPFVGPVFFTVYHLENTLFQETSFYPIHFDQKFGKPDLTQMPHEQKGCEKL